ncbi:hypothetical protein EDC04DRAFT_2604761 [Pisolithus marmoratus]|nr:hypothetical protein EDC04DRAFT_2604761 [Pisolithus marmoratus]
MDQCELTPVAKEPSVGPKVCEAHGGHQSSPLTEPEEGHQEGVSPRAESQVVEELLPVRTKHQARRQWKSGYHLPKSKKAHKNAVPEVVCPNPLHIEVTFESWLREKSVVGQLSMMRTQINFPLEITILWQPWVWSIWLAMVLVVFWILTVPSAPGPHYLRCQQAFKHNLGSGDHLVSGDQTSAPLDMQLPLVPQTTVSDGTCKYVTANLTVQSNCHDGQISVEQVLQVSVSSDHVPHQHITPDLTKQSNYSDVQMSSGMPPTLHQTSAQQHIASDLTKHHNCSEVQMSTEVPLISNQMSAVQAGKMAISNECNHHQHITLNLAEQSMYSDVQMSAEEPHAPYYASMQQAVHEVYAPVPHAGGVTGKGHKSTTCLPLNCESQQVLEQQGKSSNSIPDDVQNWFCHFEVLGSHKGLVAYQHVISAVNGLPISLPDFCQVWNSVDTEGHGWLDLGRFARFWFLVQLNWQFLVGNMEGTHFPCPLNVHANIVRYSQGKPLASMNHQAHQLQPNDSSPCQDLVMTVPSIFPHLQVDPAMTVMALTDLACTPLGPIGTTVDTWMGQNPRTSQTTGLVQFPDVSSSQFQQLHEQEQNVVDYHQLNHHAPGDVAVPFCNKPWGEPVILPVPPVPLSQHPVSVDQGIRITQCLTTDYAPHAPMFLAFGPQQAASTYQGTQPNQCCIPPVP